MKPPAEAPVETARAAAEARVEQVTGLFMSLIQALRALQLYGPTNPISARTLDSLRAGFEHVWKLDSALEIEVHPEALFLGGQPVFQNPNYADNIAFLMFRDGIRTLCFRKGFEEEELPRFLALLHRARYQATDSDDLVTLLWDEDFLHLRHGYIDVDTTAEEAREAETAIQAATGDAGAERVLTRLNQSPTAPTLQDGYDAAGFPGSADPPALPGAEASLQRHTLQLDPEALVYLQHELEEEMRRDLAQDVVNALLDSLEEPDARAQSEILQIFAVLVPQLLSERKLRLVTRILDELAELHEKPHVLEERLRHELENVFRNLAGASAVQEFLAALEAGDVQRDLDCIASFVTHFGSSMLPRMLRIREKASGKELRAALEATTERLARAHPRAVRDSLSSEDPLVVRGALRILVALGFREVVPEIQGLLGHTDTRVRLGAVEALVALGGEPGVASLVGALEDPVREVRIAALWGLATWQHAPALAPLERVIESKWFRESDSDEKIAVLDAYARIGGKVSVDRLGKLLNARKLFKPREPTELRACAARALGSVGGARARAQLERAQRDRDPDVRRTVQRSLRKAGLS